MNKDIFDQLIKQAVKEKMGSIEVPSMDDVFENIMRIRRKRKRDIFLKRVALVAASSFIVMFIMMLGTTDEGYTRFTRTLRTFFTPENEVLNLDNKVEEDFGRYDNKGNLEIDDIDELQKISKFPVKELKYIPSSYNLIDIETKTSDKEVYKIEMIFSNGTDFLFFTQMSITGQYAGVISIKEGNAELLQEEKEGIKYSIIEYKHGEIEIIWDKNEVLYNLIGVFDKQEMMKIIEFIK